MKKTLLALSITLSFYCVNAQISLTYSNHAPLVGDSCLITVYDTTNLLPINTGANQTWDFSNINLDSTGSYVLRFIAPVNPPSGAYVNEDRPSGINRYFKNSTNKLDMIGFTSPDISVSLTGDALYRTWPMSYNTTISDTGIGTYSINPNPYIPSSGPITINTKSIVSGYGNLIAPNGANYTNVLQVLDTMHFSIINVIGPYLNAIDVQICSMNYYILNVKQPIISFTVQYTVNSAFNTNTSTYDFYVKDTTSVFEFNRTPPPSTAGVILTSHNNELKIYPNPVSYLLNLETTDNLYVEIYAIDGRLIESHSVQGILSINVADYTNGMYLIRTIDSNGNISQQKFVKQ
ncbi:MAG: T9SS type A sorting domain-containing protein [Bacteroidia bacterium]